MRSRGMTLVEMIVVVTILAIVAAAGALMLGRGFESWQLARETGEVGWQGRVALERLTRELRDIRSATTNDLAFTANPMTQLRFIDVDGNAVCFYLSGTQLMRSADGPTGVCGTTSPQPLADNVVAGSLSFNFYKNDGGALTIPPDTLANAFYITLAFQVTSGQAAETWRTTVQPRRF
jgi:prepilin-type N-terminal cleavage/methylation domain-containing protein